MTGRTSSLLVCALVSLVGADPAAAQVKRPVSGQLQFYIGSGLPIPIRPKGTPMDAACLPKGGIKGVKAVKNARITTYANGAIKLPPSQFTLRGPGNPYSGKVQGVMTQNPLALQVYTNVKLYFPGPGGAPLQPHSGGNIPAPPGGAKGRTGPNTVSWCPGYTATVELGLNPGCSVPDNHASVIIHTCGTVSATNAPGCPGPNYTVKIIPGFMKYTRVGKMLGGPGSGKLGGHFDAAIGAPGGGAFFVEGYAPSMGGQQGMGFGAYFQRNVGKGPVKAPVFFNSCGIVTFIGTLGGDKALSNRTTATFGGPLTQGKLTVKVDTGASYESYMIAGYDKRTAKGAGRLALVAGAIGVRSLTGANANRAFLFFDIPEPGAVAGAVVALAVLALCHRLVTRRARALASRQE